MLVSMAGQFVYLLAISLLLGVIGGLTVSWLLKRGQMTPLNETALVYLFGFLSYLTAESLGLSGIMSLFTCSMLMSYYTNQNISLQSQ